MATIFDPPRGEEFSRKWVTIGRDSAVITIENLTFMRYRRLDRRTVTIETSIPSASQVEWIPERRRRGTVWIILLPRRTRLWTWDRNWDPCSADIVHFELIRLVLINNASKRFVQNFYSSNIYPRDGWIFLQWTTYRGLFSSFSSKNTCEIHAHSFEFYRFLSSCNISLS